MREYVHFTLSTVKQNDDICIPDFSSSFALTAIFAHRKATTISLILMITSLHKSSRVLNYFITPPLSFNNNLFVRKGKMSTSILRMFSLSYSWYRSESQCGNCTFLHSKKVYRKIRIWNGIENNCFATTRMDPRN
jgi:hypothetical protein